jgi:Zn-dependent protease with chaperone function
VADLALAWLLTAAIHSTVLLAVAAALARPRVPASLRELVWTTALLGPLLTASAQLVLLREPAAVVPAGIPSPEALADGGSALDGVPEAGAALPAIPDPGPWLALAALAGTLLLCGQRLRDCLALRRFLRARAPAPAPVPAMLAELALGLESPLPRASLHPSLGSPIAFGWLRPEVCVPRQALALPYPELRAMLAHEVAHVRRRDALRRAAGEVALALLWWQPLAWLARRELRHAAELQCDATAAGAAGRLAVAHSLVEVAGWVVAEAVPAGTTAMAERSPLSERVKALLSGRHAFAGLGVQRTAQALAALVCLAAGWTLPGERLSAAPAPAGIPPPSAAAPTTPVEALSASRRALHAEFFALCAELASGATPQEAAVLDEIERRLTRIEVRWRELQQSVRSGPASVNRTR